MEKLLKVFPEKNGPGVRAVNHISLTVEDREFMVLVGPSGCGKSTTLRMIAGLEEISAGTIAIDGRIVNEVAPKDRDIAMVFQNYALYPHMTIAENMAFSLKLAKKSKSEIDEKVRDAARILGLSDYLDRFPKQLSGGQRQRVAMGRAIVRNPQVFLFDEPLSNLDAKLRVQMRAELKDIHAKLKTTTIYVTHDQIEAMTMADRIVVLRDGLVEQIGAPLDLYDKPANMFVASFIGSPSMNFIEGTVSADGAALQTSSGIRLALPAPTEKRGAAVHGIRPEHLTIATDGDGFPVTVTNVEPTGSETFIQAQVDGQKISALLRERGRVNVGETISLRYLPANGHLFDKASGQRLSA
ncbi:MAG: sn-glycerol-3-phosphate ABC transporter ATP-binding protein UgpC [Rhizobiaceae bacterium]|nr:sn-glycerol-3-phosphate ABC transporter ATP-binding protein UgpC [Rhizobiaceae bacterium]